MKPGATTSPAALITRFADAPSSRPISVIFPSLTATEPPNHGFPLPSIMWPPTINKSYCGSCAEDCEYRTATPARNPAATTIARTCDLSRRLNNLFDGDGTRTSARFSLVTDLNQNDHDGNGKECHCATPVKYRVQKRRPYQPTGSLDEADYKSYAQADCGYNQQQTRNLLHAILHALRPVAIIISLCRFMVAPHSKGASCHRSRCGIITPP